MRAMEAELGMYKQQVDLFKSDIEAANEAMRALRHRWVAQQRRNKSQRQGGSEETIDVTASSWGSPSPAAAAAAEVAATDSAGDRVQTLLQDSKRDSEGGPSADDGSPEGDRSGEPAKGGPLPVAAG